MEESPFWHNFHLDRYVGLLSDGLHDPEKTMPSNVKKTGHECQKQLAKRGSGNVIAPHQAPNRGQRKTTA
jgi:hypothetical protein